MRKKVSKCYPRFEHTEIICNEYHSWASPRQLPDIPNRFQYLYHKGDLGSREENFVSFCSHVKFRENNRNLAQDAWFMFPELEPFKSPTSSIGIELSTGRQLEGVLYEGDVDFLIGGKITLRNGRSLTDPDTGAYLRYPYRIASYFPIRNVLLIRNLVHDTPTPSLVKAIEWIFAVTNSLGYKYTKQGDAILIGCDPEFTITDILDERINASSIFPDPRRDQTVGTDGHERTGELRPDPCACPLDLTQNIKKLMNELAIQLGNDKKILTGGGGNLASLGHHIHFNFMVSSEEIELLDDFVGYPSLKIKGAKRQDSSYEALGRDSTDAVRTQPHGCEYRTPASSLIPELTNALHTTAYCCVMKWRSLREGEEFEYDIDAHTQIPTLESYRRLDITDNKIYTPHLEEMWKWANGVDGREIDPKRDCLYRWVDGREEVKPKPGLKINWGTDIFPSVEKENFIEVDWLDKIYDLTIMTISQHEEGGDTRKTLQIFLTEEEQSKINKGEEIVLAGTDGTGWAARPLEKLRNLKRTYRIDEIKGFDKASRKIVISHPLLRSLRGMEKLKMFLLDIAKIICV